MTFESNALGNRYHFDLAARSNRSVEREYSNSFQREPTERASRGEYSSAGSYRRAGSLNVLQRTLGDSLGNKVDFDNNVRDSSQARTIAKNVLNFVRQELREARTNGANQAELQTIVNQAREGIEQGFNSAREVLQGRAEDSRLDRQIERAYNKIQRGLERLDNRFTPNVETTPEATEPGEAAANDKLIASLGGYIINPQAFRATNPPSPTEVEPVSRIEYTKTFDLQLSRSFDLSITTQEGDTVNFTIEQTFNKQANKEYVEDENGITINVDRQTSRGEEIAYNVRGDINEQEQAAIDALIKNVDRLADKFYSGNVYGAFKKAASVGIDAEQLAGFSLDLQSSKTVEITKTYREVQGVAAEQQLPSPVEQVGEFVGEVNEVVNEEPVATTIADPVPVATELFKQIAIRDERVAQLQLEQSVQLIDDLAETVEQQLENTA